MNLLLLPLFASITFAESVFASLPVVFIENCYDGDTCQAINGEKIRLANTLFFFDIAKIEFY